jgi:hypothetical protein
MGLKDLILKEPLYIQASFGEIEHNKMIIYGTYII